MVLVLYLSGCQQEIPDVIIMEDRQMLEEAIEWFYSKGTGSVFLKSGNSKDRNKVAVPMWNDIKIMSSRGIEVVEVGLAVQGAWGFASEAAHKDWLRTGNSGNLLSHTRMVITRNKTNGRINGFLMTLVGDKPYLEKKKFRIWQGNSYLEKENDFTGLVLFHDLEGQFMNGWRYINGRVSHKVRLDSGSMNIPGLKSGGCSTYYYSTWTVDYIEWYYYTLVDGNIMNHGYNGFTITDVSYEVIPVVVCFYNDDGGGEGEDFENSGTTHGFALYGNETVWELRDKYTKVYREWLLKLTGNGLYYPGQIPIHEFLDIAKKFGEVNRRYNAELYGYEYENQDFEPKTMISLFNKCK